ncbi:MAG: hypothetical protein ACP5T9_05900, partial [Thermoplasmata archaeon]
KMEIETTERIEISEKARKKYCLVWNEEENKIDEIPYPPKNGILLVTGTTSFYHSTIKDDLQEIIEKFGVRECINAKLLFYFIEKELVYRDGKYMYVDEPTKNDIVIKNGFRKITPEKEILNQPGDYWLGIGKAFIWSGKKASPAPAPARAGGH